MTLLSYLTNGFLTHSSKKELYIALEDVWKRRKSAIKLEKKLRKEGESTLSSFYRIKANNLLTEADCIAGAIVKK